MIRLRPLLLGAGASLAIGLAACGNGAPATSGSGGGGPCPGTASASAGTADATVDGTDQLTFAPNTTTVKVGQTVVWKNTGTVLHNITFSQGCLTDGAFQPGGSWSIKFTQAGSYDYQCTIHPGMTAKLSVTS